MDNINKKYQN